MSIPVSYQGDPRALCARFPLSVSPTGLVLFAEPHGTIKQAKIACYSDWHFVHDERIWCSPDQRTRTSQDLCATAYSHPNICGVRSFVTGQILSNNYLFLEHSAGPQGEVRTIAQRYGENRRNLTLPLLTPDQVRHFLPRPIVFSGLPTLLSGINQSYLIFGYVYQTQPYIAFAVLDKNQVRYCAPLSLHDKQSPVFGHGLPCAVLPFPDGSATFYFNSFTKKRTWQPSQCTLLFTKEGAFALRDQQEVAIEGSLSTPRLGARWHGAMLSSVLEEGGQRYAYYTVNDTFEHYCALR